MADSKRVRGTNVIELQAVADARTGTAVVVGAVDNLVKGAAGQAIQNLNLALGLDEAEGLPDPGGVPVSVTYPLGFRAAGVTAGLKPSGLPDLGLLVGDPGTTAAALFTTNAVAAAPIEVGRDRLARGRLRAVLVNSGQANAATGPRGIDDARRTSAEAAALLGAEPDEVLPSSTGVIGEPLHVGPDAAPRCPALVGALDDAGGEEFARAIMTTDTVHKQAMRRRRGAAGRRLRQGRRHDRAEPRHDARVRHDRRRASPPRTCGRLACEQLAPRFNALTVDGCTSHERHGAAARERRRGRRARRARLGRLARARGRDRRGGRLARLAAHRRRRRA